MQLNKKLALIALIYQFIFFFAFIFMWNTDFTFLGDWDLFASFGLPIAMLVGFSLNNKYSIEQDYHYVMLLLIIFQTFHLVKFLYFFM